MPDDVPLSETSRIPLGPFMAFLRPAV